jgi:methionyl-tRNA formyltransferase
VKFAFAGTPIFAAQLLGDLADLGRLPTVVVSQPDRPRGRGRQSCSPPVVARGEQLGIESIQVETINEPGLINSIRSKGATTLVVAAFGQILRSDVLSAFECLNIHASLLPRYRGAAPIARAIAAGDPQTGVSIMKMTEGLDEGPWAAQTALSISLRDDAGSVGRALALLGALALDQVMTGLEDGTVCWNDQQGGASYASKVTAADCVLDSLPRAIEAHNKVRSVSPGLGVRTASGGLQFKVWRTWPYGGAGLQEPPTAAARVTGLPGALAAGRDRLFVGCGEGILELLEVQPVGKARMSVAEFLRGYGSRLGGALDLEPASL